MKATNLPLISVVSLFVGSGIGWFGSTLLSEPDLIETPITEIQIQEAEISDEQLEELCSELTQEEKQNIFDVQEKVVSLQTLLQEKKKS